MTIKHFQELLVFEDLSDKLEFIIETNFDDKLDESGNKIGHRFDPKTLIIIRSMIDKLHSLEVDLCNLEDLLEKKMPEFEFIRLYEKVLDTSNDFMYTISTK